MPSRKPEDMAGRYETLRKINQNTFSVYIAPGRDLQNALISGPVRTVHGPITFLFFGHAEPLLCLPPDQKYRIDFRRMEGMSGLIGAIRKDESHLLFILYSREHFEEYEKSIPILAEECRTHARHTAPVVLLSVTYDHIIEQLGIQSDRYIIITEKNRKTIARRNIAAQKTLNDCPISPGSSHPQKEIHRYGQQPLSV